MAEQHTAFVTGASRGIGRAAAVALAGCGYDLVLAARSMREGEVREYSPRAGRSLRRAMPGSLESTASEVRARGRQALPIRMDLLEPDSIRDAVTQALERFGQLDLLLNNGLYQGPGTLDRVLDLDLADALRVLQGNLLSQLLLVQLVLPGMLAQGSGCIINMVSAAGSTDPPAPAEQGGWGFLYGASKAAFERLVGVLKVEHPDAGLRLFNLEPGLILTESMKAQGLSEELAKKFGGAPPEVPAAAIAWLATAPSAARWHGRTVSAQRLCRDLGLVAGWPTSQ